MDGEVAVQVQTALYVCYCTMHDARCTLFGWWSARSVRKCVVLCWAGLAYLGAMRAFW